MQFLFLLAKLALFVIVAAFAMKNTDAVAVHYYFGGEWQAPLVLVMLAAFGTGVAAGLIALLPRLYRQRREIDGLKRESRARMRPGTATAPLVSSDMN